MTWTEATLGMLYCNMATFALTVVLFYLMVHLVFYRLKIKDLDDDKFRNKYGTLYDGLYINHNRIKKQPP